MTRKQSLFFTYGGRDSRDFGIMQVQKGSGMFEEQFMPQRTIIEEKIPGRDEPYFFGTDTSPIEDDIVLYTDNDLTDRQIQDICDFLYAPYYQPLIFSDNPEKIYFAMFIGDNKLIHNGARRGYFTIKFRCNSAYAYSPISSREFYSTSDTEFTEITIHNQGIFDIFPIVELQKIGNGDFTIINTTDGGRETSVNRLIDSQYVKIDAENKELETNLENTEIYGNFNLNYPSLVRGLNRLKIKGKANVIVSYYYKYYS